ncbi:cytochrome P450 [Obelidium mucronatum]|nr:cytochrome P450 [Obelidium mucronatum]
MSNNLVVVLSGQEENWKKNGVTLDLNNYTTLDNLRADVVQKLKIDSPSVLFLDIHGNPLTSFDDVRTKDIVVVSGASSSTSLSTGNAIPGPPGSYIFGNLYDVFPDPLNQVRSLFNKYGPIIQLTLLGTKRVWTAHPKYAEVVGKETEDYWKRVDGTALAEMKPVGGQGLFTTNGDDPDWVLGHKLLMPAFSPRAIKAYASEMSTLADKLNVIFQEYAETGEKTLINRWMTNFTFETIGKTGFGYDFGLLEKKDAPVHPFIVSMGFCLSEGINRAKSFKIYKTLPLEVNRRYDRELKSMHKIVEDVIKVRKEQISKNLDVPKDLLTYMLTEKTDAGQGMSDSLIRDQVMTFLIAGHETTSNTLSWALFEIDRHPKVLQACLQEIVNVGISDDVPTDKQISELQYIERVLKETLRYHAPVRQVAKEARRDNSLPGGFAIPKNSNVIIAIDALHHNPDVFIDPEVFDPERWTRENEAERSIYSWMPFSQGPRGCIGRQFAMQEAKIGLAKFLRKFKFTTVDPSAVTYDPQNATTAPLNLWMTVTPQTNLPEPNKVVSVSTAKATATTPTIQPLNLELKPQNVQFPPITLLYGSNSGTSSDFANTIAAKAKKLGCSDVVVFGLDEFLPKLATRLATTTPPSTNFPGSPTIKHMVLVVTATYNGTPPDNAGEFDKWMSQDATIKSQPLKGVHFGVFGCGNKQWRTYQVFPAKVDAALEALGGTRYIAPGAGDANEDIDGDFAEFTHALYDTWVTSFGGTKLCSQETKPPGITDGFTLKTVPPSDPHWKSARQADTALLTSQILVNRELQNYAASKRSTRHLEISVDTEYLPGDHLEVLPQNDPEIVNAVAQALGLALDATFIPTAIDTSLMASTRSIAGSLEIGLPVTLRHVLTHRADLLGPPSRLLVSLFAQKLEAVGDSAAADALKFLIAPTSKKEFDAFLKKHRTLLDLLEAYPKVNNVALEEFLGSVSGVVPRRYSIASSPLVLKDRVSLAVGVVEDVDAGKVYFGQASGFFKRVAGVENVKLVASVKSCKDSFRAPEDVKTPLLMVCAGTGLAPFMGFLQDRKARGFVAPNAETHLFFGCRNEDDYIYRSELEQYEKEGVLSKIHVAFSRCKAQRKKYVQHILIDEGVLIWELLNDKGGRLYVCGAAGGMAKDVRTALLKVVTQIGGISEADAPAWLESRYIEDVWG